MTWFSSILMSTISSSIVASCGAFINYFSWLCCLKGPWTRCHHTWQLTQSKVASNRKTKLHWNAATALRCNLNWISIIIHPYVVHYDCFHWEALPPFWKFKLNVHLVSHCNGLIYFVTCKVFIDGLTICCMETEVLALQDEYSSFFLV